MPTIDAIIRDIEENAKMEFLPIIGREKGAFIEQMVQERRPCLVVEVGALVGYTTILIARHLGQGCKLLSFEISEVLANRAKANIDLAGLSAKADVIRGDAREHLGHVDGLIDMVFLDAERTQYLNYLKKIEPRLSPGAAVVAIGAGLFAKRMEAYFEYVRESGKYESTSRVFGDDAIEISTYRG